MNAELILIWLVAPALCGIFLGFVLRWRGASARQQAYGTCLTMLWPAALYLSRTDGRFDVVLFVVFFPLMTAVAAGLIEWIRRGDLRRGRGHLWE